MISDIGFQRLFIPPKLKDALEGIFFKLIWSKIVSRIQRIFCEKTPVHIIGKTILLFKRNS